METTRYDNVICFSCGISSYLNWNKTKLYTTLFCCQIEMLLCYTQKIACFDVCCDKKNKTNIPHDENTHFWRYYRNKAFQWTSEWQVLFNTCSFYSNLWQIDRKKIKIKWALKCLILLWLLSILLRKRIIFLLIYW